MLKKTNTRISRKVSYTLQNKAVVLSVGEKIGDGKRVWTHVLSVKMLKHGLSFQAVALSPLLSFLTGKLEAVNVSTLTALYVALQGLTSCERMAISDAGSLVNYKSVMGQGSKKLFKIPGSGFNVPCHTLQEAQNKLMKHLNDSKTLSPEQITDYMMQALTDKFVVETEIKLDKKELLPAWQILGEAEPAIVEVVEVVA